jgi:FkbM family methyltransferase
MEEIFTNIYQTKLWGDNKNTEYNGSSGSGSDINYNAELNYSASNNSVIPLKIFQTWNTKILPEKMQIVVDDLKTKNSEFEYFLFDDNDCEEFIKNNFGEDVLHSYNTLIPGAYKADLWRCCVLYIYGGIYLDIKYQCVNDFKLITLTDKEYFVTDELRNYISGPYKGIIWNGLMITKPKNEKLLKCINQIVKNVENKYYGFGIYEPTGPTLLTRYFTVEERKSNILTRGLDRANNYNGAKLNDTFILNEYDGYRIDRKKSVIDYTSAWKNGYVYKSQNVYNTYKNKYGLITLYSNDIYINKEFKKKNYWNEDILSKIKNFINPNKNILVIGGHCGSSSIALSSFIENEQKIYVYEPQEKLYKLLIKNIQENSLQEKIIPHNMGIFCFDGLGTMNDIDLDGGNGIITKRYNEEYYLPCNFGGATLGKNGEIVKLTTLTSVDSNYDNIGCIYCNAQGSESFIFSKSINFITKNRPVIYFVNNKKFYRYQYDKIIESYSQFKEDGDFDIIDYCIKNLNYTLNREVFQNKIHVLLLPN